MLWRIEAASGDGRDKMLGVVEAETAEEATEVVRTEWYANGNRILMASCKVVPILPVQTSGQVC